jgi:hypothetical protein
VDRDPHPLRAAGERWVKAGKYIFLYIMKKKSRGHMHKRHVLSILRAHRRRIRSFGVKKIGLFGSYARNEQKPESDIDMIVEFNRRSKSFDRFMGLSFFLEDILKHRVDLVTSESLSPYIGPHILRETEYV